MSLSFIVTDALELRASRVFEEIFAGLQGRFTIRTIDFVANEPIETGRSYVDSCSEVRWKARPQK